MIKKNYIYEHMSRKIINNLSFINKFITNNYKMYEKFTRDVKKLVKFAHLGLNSHFFLK